jgi:alanyl-tRNA synthetase
LTLRLYYSDSSCLGFEAVVTRALTHGGRPAVVLDRTAFYPTSGGQPFDTGRLGGVEVLDVIDEGGEIVHVLSHALPQGAAVTGDVDRSRRLDHMQQHTGQHVLSAAFDRLFDNRTLSFHLGAETSTIDLAREMSAAQVDEAVAEANRIVWDDRPVHVRFVSPAEAAALPLRKEPAREGDLRLIEIPDFDLSACGGTHVSRTGSIGAIAALGSERFRGGTRVTFACGGRTVRALQLHRDAVAGCVRQLSVLPGELPGAVERLQAEAKDLRKTLGRLQRELAAHEAERLLARATAAGPVRIVAEALEGWDAAGLKAMASAIASHGRAAAAVLSSADPVSVVIARSRDVAIDAGTVLQELTARYGGRGGGKPDLAQGGGLSGRASEIALAARAAIERALGARVP